MKKYFVLYKTKWWFMPLQILLIGKGNSIQATTILAHDVWEMKHKFKTSTGCCVQPIGFCKLLSFEEMPMSQMIYPSNLSETNKI